jgi:hypothetical protein
MSYNGSGTFQINTSGQPVVAGTVISATAFNALTADLATGLSTAITKDGQTTTTARIPFAAGISSTLTTDSSSISTGSIITAGGVGVAKNLYVGVNANVAGTLGVTGVATFSAAPIYSSLTASSAVATDASKGLVSVTNTGTGNNVLATSPTLVTPILGTPQSGTLTNATGLPLTTGVTGVLPEANGGTGTTTGYYGFKNRIINGAMVIDQRNAGASVTPSNGIYTLDRFGSLQTTASKYSVQQNAGSVTLPTGFANYLGCTSLSSFSVGAGDVFGQFQAIEGYNIADLAWGTANAATVTLSFRVYSSLTGTFGGSLQNSGSTRSYPFTYSVPVANTWTTVSVTVAGDTSGTWLKTNGQGIVIVFGLGVGSTYSGTAGAWAGTAYYSATGATSVVGTNGATFYITGVQLEKGSTATSFDYRPYGTELQLCQRYAYPIRGGFSGFGNGTTVVDAAVNFPVEMRSVPTVTQGTLVYAAYGTGGSFAQSSNLNSLPTFYTQNGCTLRFSNFTGLTNNAVFILVPNSTTSAVTTYGCLLTAEL